MHWFWMALCAGFVDIVFSLLDAVLIRVGFRVGIVDIILRIFVSRELETFLFARDIII